MKIGKREFLVWGMVALFAAAGIVPGLQAAERISLLIIDGQNNHNWEDTTPFLKKHLEKTGRFVVDVTTSPRPGADDEAWASWRPEFSKYDVLLSNYNNEKGSQWPDEVRKAFEKAIAGGVGLVNVHAANNAHKGWAEFEKMTGLLWRNNKEGKRFVLDANGNEKRVPVGEGPNAGHGPQHEYLVVVRDGKHPITQGMPAEWLHAKDELYHGQRGPAENMHLLATAFSAPEKKGTGDNEPMLWWIPYGKGRAVTCLLGHVNRNDSVEMPGLRCAGAMNIIERSCEWAATGEVTLPIAKNFPSKEAISLVE